jgi:hypothetical protein
MKIIIIITQSLPVYYWQSLEAGNVVLVDYKIGLYFTQRTTSSIYNIGKMSENSYSMHKEAFEGFSLESTGHSDRSCFLLMTLYTTTNTASFAGVCVGSVKVSTTPKAFLFVGSCLFHNDI